MTVKNAESGGDPQDERLRGLLLRAAAGDRDAQEEVIAGELPRLRAFVRLRAGPAVRKQESAADLVQSVCREILTDIESIEYRGAAAFRNWLYRAAERKIIDRARRLGAERRGGGRARFLPGEDEPDLRETYASLLTPSRVAGAREEVARLEEAFGTLADDYREVISLAKIVGLPHKQIAESMGRSEGAVRILLFRALAELGERLKHVE